jgi:two-component system C4-dicarboxylate transport response regulator DctD
MDAVREERFRPDLLARLEGLTVRLPPLRKRREDVPPLFSHLLQEVSEGRAPAVDGDLVERLCLHDWPFNVRELVQLVRRLLILYENDTTLGARHLPPRIGEKAATATTAAPPARKPAAASEPVELPGLMAALRAAGGNVARASAMLGITRQRAYRLMEAQGVDLEALRKAEDERR